MSLQLPFMRSIRNATHPKGLSVHPRPASGIAHMARPRSPIHLDDGGIVPGLLSGGLGILGGILGGLDASHVNANKPVLNINKPQNNPFPVPMIDRSTDPITQAVTQHIIGYQPWPGSFANGNAGVGVFGGYAPGANYKMNNSSSFEPPLSASFNTNAIGPGQAGGWAMAGGQAPVAAINTPQVAPQAVGGFLAPHTQHLSARPSSGGHASKYAGGIVGYADGGNVAPDQYGVQQSDADLMRWAQADQAVNQPWYKFGWLGNSDAAIRAPADIKRNMQTAALLGLRARARRNDETNFNDLVKQLKGLAGPGVKVQTYADGGPMPPMQAPPQQGPPQAQPQPGGDQGSGSPQDQQLFMAAVQAITGQIQDPNAAKAAIQAFIQRYGPQALQELAQHLQQMQQQGGGQSPQDPQGMASQSPQPQGIAGAAGGGAVSGPGDGMSDSVSAQVAQSGQPVALSADEHVIPADAVAMLGNGSSAAGHKKLQAGIAKLRSKKYGRAKQPPRLAANQNPIMGQ